MLFGIIQECLNNVEKHSQAEGCQVKILEENKKILVQVKDNGRGFEINNKSSHFSLGLKTMKEKADYLNAKLTLRSEKEKGTTIRLALKVTTS